MGFSPTQTARFLQCQTKWGLTREGWVPRAVYKNRIAAIAGQAFHAWAETYYRANREDPGPLVAQAAFDSGVEELRAQGFTIYADTEIATYSGLLLGAVQHYPKHDPIPKTWMLDAFEEELPDGSRIDMGGRTQHGVPFCLDFKSTTWCKPDGIQARLREYEHSWQLHHYAEVYGAKLGEPVRQVHIVLVAFAPEFSATLGTFYLDPELADWWKQSAQSTWQAMQAKVETPLHALPMAAEHGDKWGRCEYYDACFKFGRDPELMQSGYLHIERRKTGGVTENQAG